MIFAGCGGGGESGSSTGNSGLPFTEPSAPTAVVAVAGNTQATVTFNAPEFNGGGNITGYIVTAYPGNLVAVGLVSPITVSDLSNGTTYTFKVKAANAEKTGLESAASNVVTPFTNTPVITLPGAPIIGTATAGNSQATVTFTPPVFDGGSVITGYTVTSYPGNLTATGLTSPITIGGLICKTIYTFTVKATNSVGTGAASNNSNGVASTSPQILVDGYEIQRFYSGTDTFVVALRNDNAYLEKFDSNNALLWDKPVLETADYDRCNGVVNGGFVDFVCSQNNDPRWGPIINSGIVWFVRIDASTGTKIVETKLLNFGTTSIPVVDSATGMIYTSYGNDSGREFTILINPETGLIVNGFNMNGLRTLVVAGDGIYWVGRITENGMRDRVYVMKYSKDPGDRIMAIAIAIQKVFGLR